MLMVLELGLNLCRLAINPPQLVFCRLQTRCQHTQGCHCRNNIIAMLGGFDRSLVALQACGSFSLGLSCGIVGLVPSNLSSLNDLVSFLQDLRNLVVGDLERCWPRVGNFGEARFVYASLVGRVQDALVVYPERNLQHLLGVQGTEPCWLVVGTWVLWVRCWRWRWCCLGWRWEGGCLSWRVWSVGGLVPLPWPTQIPIKTMI